MSKTTQLVSAHVLERGCCWVGVCAWTPHPHEPQLCSSYPQHQVLSRLRAGVAKVVSLVRAGRPSSLPAWEERGCNLALCHLPSVVRWEPSRVILAPLRPQGRMDPLSLGPCHGLSFLMWCRARGVWGLPFGVLLAAVSGWRLHTMGPLRGISRHWPRCCPHLPPASATERVSDFGQS